MPEGAVVVPLAPADPSDGEILLAIDLINAHGLIFPQTTWQTDRRGHRRADFEDVVDQAALLQRLNELTPLLWPRLALAKRHELAIRS